MYNIFEIDLLFFPKFRMTFASGYLDLQILCCIDKYSIFKKEFDLKTIKVTSMYLTISQQFYRHLMHLNLYMIQSTY